MEKFDSLFDSEFMNDAETEEYIDALVGLIADKLRDDVGNATIVNPSEWNRMAAVYKTMKYLTKGTGAKVTYGQNKILTSTGFVTVVSKDLRFGRPDLFIKAARLASNFEVFPKIDGTVQLDFAFNELTVPIK